MARVGLEHEDRILEDPAEISAFLAQHGIWYRRFEALESLPESATNEEILAAFDAPIREQMARGGYVTADVVQVKPELPNIEEMLAKFRKEHWHDEDEVRFIVEGHGVFFIHPREAPVFRIEVGPGDMINVPKGTWHWFDLCPDRRIRAIRLFQDPAGWSPRYTGSGVDAGYEPVCLGPFDIPAK